MKTPRHVVLKRLTVILLLFSVILVPSASASGLAGAGCPPVYYRIVRGDILTSIAARYGVSIWQLQQWNHITNIDRIYVGSVLTIYPTRCAAPAPRPAPKPAPLIVTLPASAPVTLPPPVHVLWPKPDHAPWHGPAPVLWPVGQSGNCADERAVITSPGPNSQVSGMLTITGNATHENFKFYKLEYGAGSNPNTWSWFFGGEFPIWHGTLGALNTGVLPSGTYTIRVTVVDQTSNYPPPCRVTIVVR